MSVARSAIERGFEPSDASPRGIIIALLIVAGGIVSSILVSAWLYASYDSDRPLDRVESHEESFRHGAEARTSIEQSWSELERDTRANLQGYHWRDREHGVVRIPIERAMELTAKQSQ